MRFRDTVTVVRAGVTPSPDGGDDIPDWGTATTTDYPGELQPLSSSEDVVAQQRTDSTHKGFLPADADVKPTDRLRHLGLDYDIDGVPEVWRARGRPHHLEVPCYRITGG
jgi:hypothetical protein